MAVPKKKSSKSRRNMRRYSSFNQLDKPTWVISPVTKEPVRPHRVNLKAYKEGLYSDAKSASTKSSGAKASR